MSSCGTPGAGPLTRPRARPPGIWQLRECVSLQPPQGFPKSGLQLPVSWFQTIRGSVLRDQQQPPSFSATVSGMEMGLGEEMPRIPFKRENS